jgi:hypothetical protein
LGIQAKGQGALVKGRLINAATGEPAHDVQVMMPFLNLLTTSDGQGEFNLAQVPYGTQIMVVGGYNVSEDTIKVLVNGAVTETGDIRITFQALPAVSQGNLQLATISLDNDNIAADDAGVSSQNVSGLLSGGRDPFLNAAAFVFSPYRFQPRGYARSAQDVWVNGVPMNDVETGNASWSQWGGLNDVFRGRSNTYGLAPSDDGFGDLNGLTMFDATAANQRKQTRISYSLSNRSYRNRLMFTQSSGLSKKGWAYAVSLSKRWAKEGYVPGTFYNGYSYYAAVSKKFNNTHSLHLAVFGAPTARGKAAAAVQEAYDLAGTHFYNPNWGYQNGEKRNAKVAKSHQPVFILNHDFHISPSMTLKTAIGYQFGKYENSTLDWYNARDPRPDYYRNLPSYARADGRPDDALLTTQQMTANPDKYMQLNWDRLYNVNYANYETINSVDGITGNNVAGRRSVYAVGNDVDNMRKFTFNTVLRAKADAHIALATGINFISQRTESYRELQDLLGGDFFLNLNMFAVEQNVPNVNFNQYDLNHPNRLIRVGDKYNYDYWSHFSKGQWWGQAAATYNKTDFFLAANLGTHSFSRDGLFRNGLFPDNSYGKSQTYAFLTYGLKGGMTYKLNGRNYLFLNGYTGTDAPTIENTFISPRTRNTAITNPVAEQTAGLEGGYLLHAPKVNARVVGYVTDRKDGTQIKHFYNDDPAYQTFVNYVLQNTNTRFIGTELALEVKLTPSWTVTGVAALGQAFYTNNPKVSIYRDNDTSTEVKNRNVYLKNYYLSVGPQTATTLGINYRSPKYWFASANFNYTDRNYLDINPDRRTVEATDLITPGSPLYNSIIDQAKAPAVFTVDLSLGASIMLSKYIKAVSHNTFLNINIGINNLLNNQDIITGGFEQLRYDFSGNNPNKFSTKYFYGLGRNFFANVSLRF